MPQRFVVMDETLHSATADGHDLLNRTRAYVERIVHEYSANERLNEAILAVGTHVPRESYLLLAMAIGVLLLRRAVVLLSTWRAVRRHDKTD